MIPAEKALNLALTLPEAVLIVAHGGVYWAVQKAVSLPFTNINNCVPMFRRPPDQLDHPWFVFDVVS